MITKSRGIIFKSVKYRESSLILDIYTRELGLRSYVISGVRKSKAKTSASILQVMSLVDLVAYDNEKRDINRIKEIRPLILYRELLFDIYKSSVGLFILEIARKSIKEKEANPPVYDFIEEIFNYLDVTKDSISNFHLSFLIHFSEMLGFKPEDSDGGDIFDLREGIFSTSHPFHSESISGQESIAMRRLMELSIQDSHKVSLDKGTRSRLLTNLVQYYRIHLGDFGKIRSLEIFKDIFK